MTKGALRGACIALLVGIGLALPGVAKAAPPCGPKNILIVYSDDGTPAQLVSDLEAQPGVAGVDLFDAQGATPTLQQLSPYNIVLTWTNFAYADANAMGDVLADYQDSGAGIVIPLAFGFYDAGGFYLGGRWLTDGYSPFTNSGSLWFQDRTLGTYDAGHPLMQGVTALATNFGVEVGLASGAIQVAAWNTGTPLIAFKDDVVAINAYIGFDATWNGQFAKVVTNAFDWLCGGAPAAWQTVAPLPNDLFGPATASDGSYAYVFGGYSFTSIATLDTVYRYDLATDTWDTMAPLPTPELVGSAVYYPPTNKIYVFGGSQRDQAITLDTTQIYDIASNTWSSGATMPGTRSQQAAGYDPANGKIYLNGGYQTSTIDSVQSTTWEYDPVADTFTDKAPSPQMQGGTASGIVDGHLLMTGGRTNPDMTLDLTLGLRHRHGFVVAAAEFGHAEERVGRCRCSGPAVLDRRRQRCAAVHRDDRCRELRLGGEHVVAGGDIERRSFVPGHGRGRRNAGRSGRP